MSNLQVFGAYAAAFEECLADDNWSRLEQYFAEETAYLPGDGTEGLGRSGAIQALIDSVNALERTCDSRELVGQPDISEVGDTVTLKFVIRYTKAGKSDLVLDGVETIQYADGLITRMEDVFANTDELIAWRTA